MRWKVVKIRKKTISQSIIFIALFILGMTMLVPFFWTISASLKLNKDIFQYPIQWIPEVLHVDNYVEVWTRVPFLTYYLNTIKLSVIVTIGQIITCSMAAYSFSCLNYPGRDKIFITYLATLMVPWHAIMIPQFLIVKNMGLYNTHMAIILIQLFNAFGVFMLRQFMLGISKELSESAKIDGCSQWRIFTQIIMPLTKSGIATLTVFTFSFMWNDYLAPLIYLDTDGLKTIQIGLATFKNMYTAEYNLIMAGTACSMIPIVIIFILAQKHVIEGLTFSGVKG